MSESELIKIPTSRFGELEVPADKVIELVNGMIGFSDTSRYVLLDHNPPFSWLQSVDNPDLAFVVVNAAEFGEEYSFSVPIGDKDLDLKEDDDIAIINLVSVRPPPLETTVNLKAPVVVNLRTMKGRQYVLDDARFDTRFPLFAGENNDEKQEEK